jgi:hypothetical protein
MFEKGDKVKGLEKPLHPYPIMDAKLYLGEVTSLKEEKGKQLMYVKILKHKWKEYEGSGFWVYNDPLDFQLEERKMKKKKK